MAKLQIGNPWDLYALLEEFLSFMSSFFLALSSSYSPFLTCAAGSHTVLGTDVFSPGPSSNTRCLCFRLQRGSRRSTGSEACVSGHSAESDPVTPWTVARQAPLSKDFFRQECWSGLPFPSPEDSPNAGIKPMSPVSPTLPVDSLPAEP